MGSRDTVGVSLAIRVLWSLSFDEMTTVYEGIKVVSCDYSDDSTSDSNE